MIEKILPISEKKIEILREIYEEESTHLRKISAELKIHPYQTKKIIDRLVSDKVVEQKRAGKTILLTINRLSENIEQLIYLIECYKQKTENKILKGIIKNVSLFYKNKEILCCCIFGSYARGAETKESDVDILFIMKNKNAEAEIAKKISQVGTLLHLKFNPVFMDEKEFLRTLEIKEPALATMLKPSQRIIIFGIEYIVKQTFS